MIAPSIEGVAGHFPIQLPIETISRVSWFESLLSYAPIKSLVPVPILVVVLPIVWWFFRSTWSDLEHEATYYRQKLVRENKFDTRPLVCLCSLPCASRYRSTTVAVSSTIR